MRDIFNIIRWALLAIAYAGLGLAMVIGAAMYT